MYICIYIYICLYMYIYMHIYRPAARMMATVYSACGISSGIKSSAWFGLRVRHPIALPQLGWLTMLQLTCFFWTVDRIRV